LPEFVSGHAPKSTTECPKRTEYPHIALAPLAFAAAPHATGEILGIAVLLPRTLDQEQQTLCWNTVNRIRELYMPWGRWTVSLADAEERLLTLQPETWSRPHTVWSSVTPFVFDRYPKDPHGSEAMEVVRAAFVRVGLPEPCEIDVHHNPWHGGVPRASLFRPARARPGKPQRYHCHVWARFKQPIQGPVIAGAGRYYGYGLFAPLFA
jgi:CRISPR-associated protein Csb2